MWPRSHRTKKESAPKIAPPIIALLIESSPTARDSRYPSDLELRDIQQFAFHVTNASADSREIRPVSPFKVAFRELNDHIIDTGSLTEGFSIFSSVSNVRG